MSTFLSDEVRAGLEAARKTTLKKKTGLRVLAGDDFYNVLRFWEGGFALDADTAPKLRGLVGLYSGGTHLYQCLVIAASQEAGEMIYEFKRNTVVETKAPLDFFRETPAPIALLGRS